MKQLKFMLAAATAVGFAAAAQAATLSETPLVNDTFDVDSETLPVGYSYNGVDEDNDTVIKDGALNVNTGTDPVLRHLNYNAGTSIDMTDTNFKSLNIKTKVKFTVTPANDPVTVTDGDKLMVYLKEMATDDIVTGTNLVIRAAGLVYDAENDAFTSDLKEGGEEYIVEGFTIDPNEWYLLEVVAKPIKVAEGYWPVFNIYLDGEQLTVANPSGFDEEDLAVEFDASYEFDTSADFVSLQLSDIYDPFKAGVNEMALTHVGFAGEGEVDYLKADMFTAETFLDFTLVLDENVSAVSWTVNGDKQDSYTFVADADTTSFDVVIQSVTYKPGYAGTEKWDGWSATVTESTKISIGSTKFANVTTDGEVTTVTPTEATIKAAAGGAFACPESTADDYADAVAKLGKAVTWATSVAKKSYNDAMTFIKDMDFDDVTTNDVNEAAYLFNCEPTPAAVAAEAAAFKFPSFTKDMTIDAMKAAVEADKNYNGTVEIHGATTLENGGDWANGQSGSFYKAVLTK